jgi:hypothetical protein
MAVGNNRHWRRPVRATDDPADLAPDERRRDLATIFAAGMLRLRTRDAVPASDLVPEIIRNLVPDALSCPQKPRSVSTVVNGLRDFQAQGESHEH